MNEIFREGWLSCAGCGTTGPYELVNGRAYCKACRREGVPEKDRIRLFGRPDPATYGRDDRD